MSKVYILTSRPVYHSPLVGMQTGFRIPSNFTRLSNLIIAISLSNVVCEYLGCFVIFSA